MRKILFVGGGILTLFIVGYLVVAMLGGGSSSEETPTPTATTSATLNPSVKNLRSYFGAPGNSIGLDDATTARTDFRGAILTAQPAQKQAIPVSIKKADAPMSASGFLQAMIDGVPTDLVSALGSDWVALAFGQSEGFNGTGEKILRDQPSPRLALIIELSDASKTNQAMSAWEATGLASSSAELFGYDVSKAIITSFSSGTYRQITVRYWNFPYADQSIDYAIALGSNGKNYLVMAGSREAAFFAIDQLMQ